MAKNFDVMYDDCLRQVMLDPDHRSAPRGKGISEVLAYRGVLYDPRDRLLTVSARKANYGFAVGEFLWYWQGKRDLETMVYYNKRMTDFSNDGETVNSAYGFRLRKEWLVGSYIENEKSFERLSQWDTVKRTLADDPDSRRAVMTINRPADQVDAIVDGSKDVPCTLSLQFFVRDKKLYLHVNMRSNDAIWGLTYDLFSFTLFQECMMLELRRDYPEKFGDLELGYYYHTAGSMHVYEPMYKMANEIIKEYEFCPDRFCEGTLMGPLNLTELEDLRHNEEFLRKKVIDKIPEHLFTGGCRWMANELNLHREKRDAEGI